MNQSPNEVSEKIRTLTAGYLQYRASCKEENSNKDGLKLELGDRITIKEILETGFIVKSLLTSGNKIFCGAKDGSIKIWDKGLDSKYIQCQTLEGHTDTVSSIALSFDEKWLFSGGWDCHIRIWKVGERGKYEQIQVIEGHSLRIVSLTVPLDEKWLISRGDDGLIKVWERSSNNKYRLFQAIEAGSSLDSPLTLSSDGEMLFSGGDGCRIRVWVRGKDNKYLQNQIIDGQIHLVSSLALSPDNNLLFSGGDNGAIKIWERNNEYQFNQIQIIQRHTNSVSSLALSSDGKWLFSGGYDKNIVIWTRRPGNRFQVTQVIEGHSDSVSCLALSLNEKWLFSGGYDKVIKVWERGEDNHFQGIQNLRGDTTSIRSFKLSLDEKSLFGGGNDNTITVWQRDESDCFKEIQTLEGHSNSVSSLTLSCDNNFLFSGGEDTLIIIWQKGQDKKYNQSQILEGHTHLVSSLELSQDQVLLFSGGYDNNIMVWQRGKDTKYQKIQILQSHSDFINALALSRNGKILFSGGQDNKIKIWGKGQDGKFLEKHSYEGHMNGVHSLILPSNDKWLFSGGGDNKIRIWECDKKNRYHEIQVLEGHAEWVSSLALSSDEKWMFSGGNDTSLKVWSIVSDFTSFDIPCKNTIESIISSKKSSSIFFLSLTDIHLMSQIPHFTSLADQHVISRSNELLKSSFSLGATQAFLNWIIEDFPDFNKNSYEDLVAVHQRYSVILLMVISRHTECLKQALDYFGYHYYFYKDTPDFDPLLLSLDLNDSNLLNIWASYFEEHLEEFNPDYVQFHFERILLCSSDPLKIILSKRLLYKSRYSGMNLPDMYSLPHDESFRALSSENKTITPETMKLFSKTTKNSERLSKVDFLTTSIPLDLRFTSPFPSILIQTMVNCSYEVQMTDLRMLIRVLFNNTKYFLWIQSIANWVSLIALLMIIVWKQDEWYFKVIFFTLYTSFIFYELVVMTHNVALYIRDIYNWVDLPIYVIGVGLALNSVLKYREFLTDIYWNFLIMLYFAVAIFRSISMLKVMDNSRYMIEMIMVSFKDMRNFLLIMTCFMLGIGTLRIILRIPDGEFEGTFDEFWIVSDMIYNWGYGNWDDSSEMKWNVYFLYIFTSVFLALVMMNMLIAIISQTFEQYTENRERENVKQMLKVLSDINAFLRNFYSPDTISKKQTFIHFIKERNTEDITNKEINNKIDSANDQVNERIDLVSQKLIEIMTAKIDDVKKEIIEQIRKS